MLHLHAGVHLNEYVVAALIHEELHCAGTFIVDVLAEVHGILADALSQLRIQRWRGSDFYDLLVAALHGAITLKKVDDVALGIREHLHLNVLWINHRGLEVHAAIAKRRLGLA